MSGEFEDRESETLGELPTSVQTERREFSQADADKVPVQIPPDFAIGQQGSNAPTPPDIRKQSQALDKGRGRIGSPVIPATVTSVYDSRPINGRDFKVTSVQLLSSDTAPPAITPQTLTATYKVPLGFTGVLRSFQFSPHIMIDTDLADVTDDFYSLVTVSLLINGIVQQDYNGLTFGAYMDLAQDTFLIASELQTFTFQAVFSAQYISIVSGNPFGFETTPVLMQMYGNNLLTRGLPTPFEIASQVKSGINAEG